MYSAALLSLGSGRRIRRGTAAWRCRPPVTGSGPQLRSPGEFRRRTPPSVLRSSKEGGHAHRFGSARPEAAAAAAGAAAILAPRFLRFGAREEGGDGRPGHPAARLRARAHARQPPPLPVAREDERIRGVSANDWFADPPALGSALDPPVGIDPGVYPAYPLCRDADADEPPVATGRLQRGPRLRRRELRRADDALERICRIN